MKTFSSGRTGGVFLTITLILGLILIVLGTTVRTSGSEWSVFAGVALFLLAGVPAVGRLTGSSSFAPTDRKKISTGLVTLSSAAILAVYAAGYDRTNTAADGFAEQAASPRRRSAPVPAAGRTVAPAAVEAPVDTMPRPEVPENVTRVPDGTVTAAPLSGPAPSMPVPPTSVGDVSTTVPEMTATASAPVTAPASEPQPVVVPVAAVAGPKEEKWEYVDGAYWGWGRCRHGDLQVQVVIEAGRIASAAISKCLTRYPCSMIKEVPPQVVVTQDPDKIDNVSGATDSVDAYYDAVIDALNKAVK